MSKEGRSADEAGGHPAGETGGGGAVLRAEDSGAVVRPGAVDGVFWTDSRGIGGLQGTPEHGEEQRDCCGEFEGVQEVTWE